MGIFDFLLSKDVRLQKAIETKNLNEVIKQINEGANVNISTENGHNAWWLAVETGSMKLAKLLLANKANLDTAFEEGNTALLKALMLGNTEIVNLLIETKSSINIVNNNGITPLIQALLMADYSSTELLIANGAEVNTKYNGNSVLWLLLSENKNIKVVNLLLDKNLTLNQENEAGYTELMYVINIGDHNLVQLFLDYGADVNYYSKKLKASPLSLAIKKNQLSTVKKLIEHKVKLDFENKNINSPIGIAISENKKDILKLLLENGAELQKRQDRDSYLMQAVCKENASIEIVKLLVKYGADINEEELNNLQGGYSYIPLMMAINFKNFHIAEYLIENGANLNYESNGRSPLNYAVRAGNERILSLFKQKNIILKAENYFNAALFSSYEEISDGDLTIRNYSEDTPLLLTKAIELDPDYAEAYGYRGVYFSSELEFSQNPSLIKKALSDLNNAIKLGATNPLFYFQRAKANNESGNIEAAISDYSNYLRSYPNGSAAFNNRGLLYAEIGNFQAALKDFTIAIKHSTYKVDAYGNRASCYLKMNREDKAILDWQEGIKISPNDPIFIKNIGVYYYNQIASKGPDYYPGKAMEYLKRSGWEFGDDYSKALYNNLAKIFGK